MSPENNMYFVKSTSPINLYNCTKRLSNNTT